jgi:uncharacterized linocin/CFP29 family protein
VNDRDAQVGWSQAQWNRVHEEVLRAWQSVRVAGSFLPVYGALPPGTQVVPSEVIKPDDTVDDQATAVLLEIALPVTLSRQQVLEEDLSDALLQFRRRASQVGQLEDWLIFNGTYPSGRLLPQGIPMSEGEVGHPPVSHLPSSPYLNPLVERNWPFLKGFPEPIAGPRTQIRGLRLRNPGALGLIAGANHEVPGQGGSPPRADNAGLMSAIVRAMNWLEADGYVAPFVCVFGRGPFEAAHEPISNNSSSFPRDRLEPLIGRELLHASAIDVLPRPIDKPQVADEVWQNRGVLLSLTGDAIDLAVAVEAMPEFRHVDADGRYVFVVFERFALRIKDSKAIVSLEFTSP